MNDSSLVEKVLAFGCSRPGSKLVFLLLKGDSPEKTSVSHRRQLGCSRGRGREEGRNVSTLFTSAQSKRIR